jgi:tRNA G18 (ribose-2'-O)-methylase SpoU
MRGYFGIGIENSKNKINIGTLWRSAYSFHASFMFVVGERYKQQASDTTKTFKHIPLYEYKTFNEFYSNIPKDCKLIGVEINEVAKDLKSFNHPERCIYLLGAEDNGLSKYAQSKCHILIKINTKYSLNVSTAGSIVMYDRLIKG